MGRRVLRFDSGFAAEGYGIALRAMSFIAACRRQRCQRQRKPYNRACGALEMHPYPRLRRYFSTGKRLT